MAKVRYKPVAGFPGYRVGTDGSVWSCREQVRATTHRGFVTVMRGRWKRLAVIPHENGGHCRVSLCNNGTHNRWVHHLVLEAFVGHCPPGMQACHFPDRNPANNRVTNLRWDTPSANSLDAVKHGTHPARRGERHHMAKLTEHKVMLIRAARVRGIRRSVLAARYGVRPNTITRVCRRGWRHV